MPNITSQIQSIRQAKTLREHFSIDLPIAIDDLTDMKSFKKIDGGRDFVGAMIDHKETVWTEPLKESFNEISKIIAAHEQRALESEDQGVSLFNQMRRGRNGDFSYHQDGLLPSDRRIYLAYNIQPTLVVPHSDTLGIIENSIYRDILDMDIKQDQDKMRTLIYSEDMSNSRPYNKILDELGKAAIELPAKKILLMSDATFHSRPKEQSQGRRFSRTYVRDYQFSAR